MNKSNTGKWKEEEAKVSYEKLNSSKTYYPDTSLHTFQRNHFTETWYRDLGNLGSPANNLLFTPDYPVGPSLGYHVMDIYRLNVDSLNYYNTNRAYSAFSFQLGSKLEQTASILHTQNIKPNWNFAVSYRKFNTPGFYNSERNNHDIAGLTTNYKSLDKHYVLNMAMVFNKLQHDENGGLVDANQLADQSFDDRKTIATAYQNATYSTTRSPVTNVQREYTLLVQHSYRWGRTDTTYDADSTQFTYRLIPRFSLTHKLQLSTERHTYKDLIPDSLRYTSLFNYRFPSSGTGYYQPGGDSVFMQQNWFWIDNQVLLNGFLGREGRQMEFSAGLGNRYDQFVSRPTSNIIKDSLPKLYYTTGVDRSSILSNYLVAQLNKEALSAASWDYRAAVRFYLTGTDAGNFVADAHIGRQLGGNWGRFVAGFRQSLGAAPYSYTNYEHLYDKSIFSFGNQSVTMLYTSIESPKLRLYGGVRNYVIDNYSYINDSEKPAQYTIPFTTTQVWLRKIFVWGDVVLDNELAWQQMPDNAPVNVPDFMGRHQLSYERTMFKRRLKIATGVEVRYNTAYHPAGYDALLNKFFYQKTAYIGNNPELAIFLNFRVKRFRAFVMMDNLQQIFTTNTLLYTGTPVLNYQNAGANYLPVYASPDVMLRFGFTWVMVN